MLGGGSLVMAQRVSNQDLAREVVLAGIDVPDHQHVEASKQDVDWVYDEGKDAWLTILGTWMIQFCTYGYISAFGVYQDYYTRVSLRNETPSNIRYGLSPSLYEDKN
ncbi:hypothetical protein NLJ89_g7945 [Agrocybe chaxingu]|uniref:Uncharacterized protein n=1 Tax=Agrocybe chaxingu TaxID=84603 RepID=A0A9W8MR92_9AGAR|nr:hypothetical protein NLJ89_g7945 [Agrocybe chaxingu]